VAGWIRRIGRKIVQIPADRVARQQLLRELGGDGTKNAAERELKVLGRNGQLPWLLPDACGFVPYCRSARLVKSSPAHALLHGIVKPFMAYGVLAGKDDVPVPAQWGENPVVFDYRGRAILAVCFNSSTVQLSARVYLHHEQWLL
jgi:hypothetical protein